MMCPVLRFEKILPQDGGTTILFSLASTYYFVTTTNAAITSPGAISVRDSAIIPKSPSFTSLVFTFCCWSSRIFSASDLYGTPENLYLISDCERPG